jgi:hypothetical protein
MHIGSITVFSNSSSTSTTALCPHTTCLLLLPLP